MVLLIQNNKKLHPVAFLHQVTAAYLLLCPLPTRSSSITTPPTHFMHVVLFPKPLNEWCFCGRVLWGFCRARRPECHRSRLIYPPPLSSCYAWSLNFPFLLFFLCFCSQIPPRPLHPLTPLLSLPIFSFFLRGRLVLAEHDTRSTHATLFSSPRARSKILDICHAGRTGQPQM